MTRWVSNNELARQSPCKDVGMENVKIIILRIIIFVLVFTGLLIPNFYFMVEDPFYLKQQPIVSTIKVWLDTNGNGKRESNEPHLPNICVWAGDAWSFQILGGWQNICYFPDSSTYLSGARGYFLIGDSCSKIYNAINPPKDYFPTTPTIVKGCSAEFGLSKEKPLVEMKQQDVGLYLAKESQNEDTILNVKIGVGILLISLSAGFVSFKGLVRLRQKRANTACT